MNPSLGPARNLSVLLLVFLAFGDDPAYTQEKSVRPGINKQYENPDINENYFVRFTKAGPPHGRK